MSVEEVPVNIRIATLLGLQHILPGDVLHLPDRAFDICVIILREEDEFHPKCDQIVVRFVGLGSAGLTNRSLVVRDPDGNLYGHAEFTVVDDENQAVVRYLPVDAALVLELR